MKVVAYIPARGGSKRVPRKNVRPIGGRPALAHVVKALRPLEFLCGVCVSTDDPEIAVIASERGATVLALRQPTLADDRADMADLLRADVPRYLEHLKIAPDEGHVLFVMPTAVLLPGDLFRRAYERYRDTRANILVATVTYPITPFWALQQTPNGSWQPLFKERLSQRSQDLPKTCVDASLFYLLNYTVMRAHSGHWLGVEQGVVPFDVPEELAVDVDTEEDWAELERKYAVGKGRGQGHENR